MRPLLFTTAAGHTARGATRPLVEAAVPRTASLKVAGVAGCGAEGGDGGGGCGEGGGGDGGAPGLPPGAWKGGWGGGAWGGVADGAGGGGAGGTSPEEGAVAEGGAWGDGGGGDGGDGGEGAAEDAEVHGSLGRQRMGGARTVMGEKPGTTKLGGTWYLPLILVGVRTMQSMRSAQVPAPHVKGLMMAMTPPGKARSP